MSYNRTQWVSGETPLSAQNFNNMEDGIEENKEAVSSLIDAMGDEWNQTTTYKVGDYVIYYNALWKCLVDNTGQTPQEGTYWTERKIATEFTELNSNIKDLFTWKLVGSVTGSKDISLSGLQDKIHELSIWVSVGTSAIYTTFDVPYEFGGGSLLVNKYSSDSNGYAAVYCTKDKITLQASYNGNTNVTSQSVIHVYYR